MPSDEFVAVFRCDQCGGFEGSRAMSSVYGSRGTCQRCTDKNGGISR